MRSNSGASAKPSNFCEKFASKKYPPGRVAVFGCGAKVLMGGVVVAVAHDEFRGMGLSGVSGFLGAGFLVDCGGKGICILTASVKKGDENYGKISIDHRHNRAGRLILG